MQASIRLTVPESAQATMTVTMTIKEWKEFRAQLVESWPSWKIASAISDVINEAEKSCWKIAGE